MARLNFGLSLFRLFSRNVFTVIFIYQFCETFYKYPDMTCLNPCNLVSPPSSFRNIVLENGSEEGKIKAPKPMKTGTTIAGVVYKVTRNHTCKNVCLIQIQTTQQTICVCIGWCSSGSRHKSHL